MKTYSDQNVYDAAIDRMNFIFDEFQRVCVSFSGGKDSTVMLHLALDVARERGRKIDVLFVDLEGQYKHTIEHVEEMLALPEVVPHWICVPLNLRNAVSVFHPHWCCWEPGQEEYWIRPLPKHPAVINNPSIFPFYRYRMEFEEFVPAFQDWLAGDETMACLVGIRADESLNRFRAVVKDRASRYRDLGWTRKISTKTCSCYPIYDWRTEDIWGYIGKNGYTYNRLYDRMYLTGMSIHDMRICQPYGDDQRKGLDLFHKIEPDTWFRAVNRVSGANFGNLYCKQKMLGYHNGLGLPEGHTWESYTELLLSTMPENSRNHYLMKFEVFIWWWKTKGGWKGDIPDEGPKELEAAKKYPSWRRMCMCILKNDFWCKSLSFAMTKDLYKKFYQKIEQGETPQKSDHIAMIKDKYRDI